jgi:hypothetical protein
VSLYSPAQNDLDASHFCAFLCDDKGQIIHELREQPPSHSSELIFAHPFFRLSGSRSLEDFLKTFRAHDPAQEHEMRIQYGEPVTRLLLHGFQTPYGILVLVTSMPVAAAPDARPADSTNPAPHKSDNATLLFNALHDLKNSASSIVNSCEYLTEYSRDNLSSEQLEVIAGVYSTATVLLRLSETISELAAG